MINIDFQVNKDLLARLLISKNCLPTELANALFTKYKESYNLLKDNVNCDKIDEQILLELQQTDYYQEAFSKSENNKQRILDNWEQNKDAINKYVHDTLNMDINLNMSAMIVLPALCSGFNMGNNTFAWGHRDGVKDENYDLVYLVHESLHSFFENNQLTHAVIENIADVGLAKELSEGKTSYTGHKSLQHEHSIVDPLWQKYLYAVKNNIKLTFVDAETNQQVSRVPNVVDFVNQVAQMENQSSNSICDTPNSKDTIKYTTHSSAVREKL